MRPLVVDGEGAVKAGRAALGLAAELRLREQPLPQERLLERPLRVQLRAGRHLPGQVPMGDSITGKAAMGPAVAQGEYNHEPVTAIYSSAGGHLTFDGGHFACRQRCISAVA